MFDEVKKSLHWGERILTLETGKIARQADSAVLATYGETSVLAAVVFSKSEESSRDFLPLTINYQEKYYASGKIPGGFFKREGRPTEKESLTARLIDRPIRPLFVEGFKNEIQVSLTVLSHDLSNDPDIVAMIAASAALTLSGVPFMGPIGGCRVGFVQGEYFLNPSIDDMHDLRNNPEQRLDLVVSGTKDAVMMVESEAYELTESEMLGAISFAHAKIQPVIELIIELAEEAAKEPFDYQRPETHELESKVETVGKEFMKAAFAITQKQERTVSISKARAAIIEGLSEEEQKDPFLGDVIKKLEGSIVRKNAVENGNRIDGRILGEVRDISCETSI
jgi:polyribonucleotide nucleotidyltransferase